MAQAAGRVKVILEVDGATYSKALDNLKKELGTLETGVKRMGHSTVSEMQAASASIRLFEGGMTNNIRAVERFITTIPGVGAALKVAFPLVGALAFIGLIVKMGVELGDFIKKQDEAKQKFIQDTQAIVASGETRNDQLILTNAKLDEQIAKLEGKPRNGLAVALNEAKVAADELYHSLDSDVNKITEMFQKNEVGFLKSLLGNATTDDLTKQALKFQNGLFGVHEQDRNDLSHATPQNIDAIRESNAKRDAGYLSAELGNITTQLSQAQALQDQRDAVLGKTLGSKLGAISGGWVNPQSLPPADQTKRIRQLQTERTDLQSDVDFVDLSFDKTSKQGRLAGDKANKGAKNTAAEDLKKDMQEQLATAEADHRVSVAEEIGYWKSAQDAVKGGSKPFLDLKREITLTLGHLYQQQNAQQERAAEEDTHRQQEDVQKLDTYNNRLKAAEDKQLAEIARYAEEKQRLLNEGDKIGTDNATALAETNLQIEVSTGKISALGAAQQEAEIRTKAHKVALAELQKQLDDIATDPNLSDSEKDLASTKVKNAQSKEKNNGDIQSARDQANTDANTPGGALRNQLGVFVQDSHNAAQQVTEIWSQGISGLNQQLSALVTGQRTNWSGFFRSLGQSVATMGLKKIESGALSALGLAKADGSAGNPFWVRMFGGIPGSPASTISSAASGVKSGFGGIISGVLGSLAGFAEGGAVSGNMPIIVGERGPEVFVPGSHGSIVPNHNLGAGGSHAFYTIDARGNNEAAINDNMHRALVQVHGSAVKTSASAINESMKRRPRSARI